MSLADGGLLTGTRFGGGHRIVVMLHGMRYDQSSWHPFAAELATTGLAPLTLDFRGYGTSSARKQPGSDAGDVASVVARLRADGASEVSLLGGSMGGGAALEAAALFGAKVDRIAVLSPAVEPTRLAGKLPTVPMLILASEAEPMADEAIALQRMSPHLAQIHLYPGDAHAQRLLVGPHQADVRARLVRFFSDGMREQPDIGR
ncbi:MAG: alpha/beta fold hydrolase [Thermaerobacter sp.]|nr:alpha/beta fold hydrolase [Thermaerobacter sp.]